MGFFTEFRSALKTQKIRNNYKKVLYQGARINAGMTLKEAAHMSNLPMLRLIHIEEGLKQATIQEQLSIADAYGLRMDYFMLSPHG